MAKLSKKKTGKTPLSFRDWPFFTLLTTSPEYAWLWLVARLYLGWMWLEAGWDKLQNPAWMNTGLALRGFWSRAVEIPQTGRPLVAYDWYRDFLRLLLDSGSHVWFAKLVAIGEFTVGALLIAGLFTGLVATVGGFMSWNFMMAGTASTNPVMFIIAVALILAWRTAGWWGLDRWVLPALGTPWQRGKGSSASQTSVDIRDTA